MAYIPMYKRMQGDFCKSFQSIPDEHRQEIYERYGITHGVPGSVEESEVREKLATILDSVEGRESRLDALEALHWFTVNNVENGGVSDVIEEVDSASRSVLYEKGGTYILDTQRKEMNHE